MRLVCVEVPLDQTRDAVEVEVGEGAGVEHALASYLRSNAICLGLEQLKQASFFVNREPAHLTTALADGDEVMVIRTLAGG